MIFNDFWLFPVGQNQQEMRWNSVGKYCGLSCQDAMACICIAEGLLCLKISSNLKVATWWVGSNVDRLEARGFV